MLAGLTRGRLGHRLDARRPNANVWKKHEIIIVENAPADAHVIALPNGDVILVIDGASD
jgi:hypothetical protein